MKGVSDFHQDSTLIVGVPAYNAHICANFDLLLTRAGEHYRAFVVDAPAGRVSVVFDLPRVNP